MILQLVFVSIVLIVLTTVWLLIKMKDSREYFNHNSTDNAGNFDYKSSKPNRSEKPIKTAVFVVLIMISSLWLFFQTKANNQKSANSSSKKAKKLLDEDKANDEARKSKEELQLEAIFKD